MTSPAGRKLHYSRDELLDLSTSPLIRKPVDFPDADWVPIPGQAWFGQPARRKGADGEYGTDEGEAGRDTSTSLRPIPRFGLIESGYDAKERGWDEKAANIPSILHKRVQSRDNDDSSSRGADNYKLSTWRKYGNSQEDLHMHRSTGVDKGFGNVKTGGRVGVADSSNWRLRRHEEDNDSKLTHKYQESTSDPCNVKSGNESGNDFCLNGKSGSSQPHTLADFEAWRAQMKKQSKVSKVKNDLERIKPPPGLEFPDEKSAVDFRDAACCNPTPNSAVTVAGVDDFFATKSLTTATCDPNIDLFPNRASRFTKFFSPPTEANNQHNVIKNQPNSLNRTVQPSNRKTEEDAAAFARVLAMLNKSKLSANGLAPTVQHIQQQQIMQHRNESTKPDADTLFFRSLLRNSQDQQNSQFQQSEPVYQSQQIHLSTPTSTAANHYPRHPPPPPGWQHAAPGYPLPINLPYRGYHSSPSVPSQYIPSTEKRLLHPPPGFAFDTLSNNFGKLNDKN